MELKNYLSVLKKWTLPIIAFTLISTLLTTTLVLTIPPSYKASTLLIVNQTQGNTINLNDVMTAERLARTYAEIITKRPVLEAVITDLNLALTPRELAKKVEVQLIRDTQLINISVKDTNPKKAAIFANNIAKNFQGEVLKIQQSGGEKGNANTIGIVEEAKEPEKPDSPKKKLSISLSFVLSFLTISAIVFLFEYLDDTLKSDDDVKNFLKAENLGTLTYIKEENRRPGQILSLADSTSSVTEAVREIRTNIQFAEPQTKTRVLIITSAKQGEGKSLLCSNLAVVMAQAGYKTALIDGDLRRPILHETFSLPNDFGLSAMLISENLGELTLQKTKVPNLSLITSGPFLPNPTEWLGSTRMHKILEALKEKGFNIILFDSPPVGMVTDAAVLSSMADGTIICVEAGKTSRDLVSKAIGSIQRVGGSVLGIVLNFKKPSKALSNYYYQKRYYEKDKALSTRD